MKNNEYCERRIGGIEETRTRCQNNYVVLPHNVIHLAGESLYLIIAGWCLLENRWINRNDIATAFRMTEQRASYWLYCISRKKRVVCRTRSNLSGDRGCPRSEILVEYINSSPETRCNKSPRLRREQVKAASILARGVGNGMTGNVCLWETMLMRGREGGRNE
ncbi:CaiF/GrlA family transcriptional regulator [Salmonella enterica subsp. enterica serovar Oslo]|nr:CaiF/GrlA family transcriptional regulator [Salmonella enterica subsp. enterica serovar Oslo]